MSPARTMARTLPDPAAPSLTRRLAVSVAVAAAALAYGRAAARQSYDRLILGAANEIAGAVRVRSGEILVDIPASAFELLSLAPDDRVLYAVYGPDGALVTGMAVPGRPAESPGFAETNFAGEKQRGERESLHVASSEVRRVTGGACLTMARPHHAKLARS